MKCLNLYLNFAFCHQLKLEAILVHIENEQCSKHIDSPQIYKMITVVDSGKVFKGCLVKCGVSDLRLELSLSGYKTFFVWLIVQSRKLILGSRHSMIPTAVNLLTFRTPLFYVIIHLTDTFLQCTAVAGCLLGLLAMHVTVNPLPIVKKKRKKGVSVHHCFSNPDASGLHRLTDP